MTTNTMFSTREVPWMRLGELAEEPLTAGEAAQMGGMNFTVSKRQTAYTDQHGVWKHNPNRVAIVRDDNEQFIEYAAPGYEILQFRDAFNFMDTINPRYVAAGTLRKGHQGFMVVKPEIELAPVGDEHELYVILRTSHDKTRAIEVSVMPLRGACMNQLALASLTRGVKHRWAIKHSRNLHAQLHDAQKSIERVIGYRDEFERIVERLAMVNPSKDQGRDMIEEHLHLKGQKRDELIDGIMDNWLTNTETVGYNGTGWGLVNAMSEFMDWQMVGPKVNAETRFINAMNGATYKALNGITKQCLELAA